MGVFNGGSAKPPEADLSPPPFAVVAPRSARLAESFSASSPENPLKKCGPLDIDRIDVLETGSTKLPKTNLSPSAPAVIVPREINVTNRPSKKICQASGSSSASSRRHVWADLTSILLQEIMFLFSSFHDILAVTGTCCSWRAAVSSFPSVNTFNIPPLHLKRSIRYACRHTAGSMHNPLSNYKWQLVDPAKTNVSLCRSAPRNTPTYMRYLSCSYGHLIFSCRVHFLLVDVYTCTKVKAPKLQANSNGLVYYGTLSAPLGSPNSCLLLCSRKSMFQWKVGTNSWTEHPLVAQHILQIVFFKGQIFAMDAYHELNTISLEPQLSIQGVVVSWGKDMVAGLYYDPWLVVCGDMLLMVILSVKSFQKFNGMFQVFRLDFSAKPAKWVRMQRLEDWALFVSLDRGCHTFSCRSPERWGGRSNCIYVSNACKDYDKPWIEVQLGQRVSSTTHPISGSLSGGSYEFESMWVLPSLVYGVGQ